MAAVGGVIAVSRANSVDPNTGGSNVLLYAVGAAVIGGTSLFGGKGRVLDAGIGGGGNAPGDKGVGLLWFSGGAEVAPTRPIPLLPPALGAASPPRAARTPD